MAKILTLRKLTYQESGIICYENKAVAVVNWSRYGEEEIPMYLDPIGMMGWSFENIFEGFKKYEVDDIRKELPGSIWKSEEDDDEICFDTDMNIVYDANQDLPQLFLSDKATTGTVYVLNNGFKVIAPDMWS